MSAHGDHDMGHTVAGWTGSLLAVAGTAVAGTAFAAGSTAVLWAGLALLPAAALTTWLLHLAGWGKATGPRPPGRRDWRLRDPHARHGHPDCLGCRLAGRGHRAPAPGRAVPAPGRVRVQAPRTGTEPVRAASRTAS
ncbi:HGxxPAAW family protein [Kitasatospora sp. NPDC093679]|uniref:HGxxPAAW family protein n=1 Tax=Kitasatospora sp. NPDC093679 TaxID=3154983 RepID=UPI003425F63E